MSNFMIINPVGTELLRADGLTDMTKLTFPFAVLGTRLKTTSFVFTKLSVCALQ